MNQAKFNFCTCVKYLMQTVLSQIPATGVTSPLLILVSVVCIYGYSAHNIVPFTYVVSCSVYTQIFKWIKMIFCVSRNLCCITFMTKPFPL